MSHTDEPDPNPAATAEPSPIVELDIREPARLAAAASDAFQRAAGEMLANGSGDWDGRITVVATGLQGQEAEIERQRVAANRRIARLIDDLALQLPDGTALAGDVLTGAEQERRALRPDAPNREPVRGKLVLHASASFYGTHVEDTFAAHGQVLQIGNSSSMAVPVPAGAPYIARIWWKGPRTALVRDGRGNEHELGPDGVVRVAVGPVELELRLIPRYSLQRSTPIRAWGSLAWLAIVMMSSLTAMQGELVYTNRCEWVFPLVAPTITQPDAMYLLSLGLAGAVGTLLVMPLLLRRPLFRFLRGPDYEPEPISAPIVVGLLSVVMMGAVWAPEEAQLSARQLAAECRGEEGAPPSITTRVTAEYLARLLEEDYAGQEQARLQAQEREQHDRKSDSIYIPAGDRGPITEMGGAEDSAPEPVRTPEEEEQVAKAVEPEPAPLAAPEGIGTEIEEAPDKDPVDDAVADASDDEIADEEVDATEAPAEEKVGWGIRDWYDETDQAMEEIEIASQLRAARERLRIDPDDPTALSVLSYYQYLAQDYDSALGTYDKYIRLYPEQSAGYNNKALVYKRKGDYKKEEGLYRVALAIEPQDKTALNNLAVNLAHQQRYDEALAIMKELETIDPEEPYADLHRAKIYAEMGEDDLALRYLELALEGMAALDTLHHIEFRQDIRVDPSFEGLRQTERFRAILVKYYGDDSPLQD